MLADRIRAYCFILLIVASYCDLYIISHIFYSAPSSKLGDLPTEVITSKAANLICNSMMTTQDKWKS